MANRTGYTLTGWKDTANSTGMSYTTNSTICGKALTLYAQWKANQYKIHYNSNGGSGTMNDSTVTYDGSFTLPKIHLQITAISSLDGVRQRMEMLQLTKIRKRSNIRRLLTLPYMRYGEMASIRSASCQMEHRQMQRSYR